jgi:hypothetical protein
MSLSYTQIVETFDDGTGSPIASGTAQFTVNTTIYASGVPILQPDVPIVAQIINGQLRSVSGGVLQLLDLASTSLSMIGQTGFWFWTVAITAGGQVLEPWSFFLEHSSTPVDLYSLANTQQSTFSNPLTELGDLFVGGADGSPSRLAGNTSATREFLISEGTGTEAQAEVWGPIEASDIPDTAVTPGSYTSTNLTVGADGRITAASDGTGGGVTEVFGRTGEVTAESGDYSVGQVTGAAPLASPPFTGTPTAPTASALTDSTQLATTAYADSAVGVETARAEAAEALLAPKASPTLTGTPAAPTASPLTDSTQLATTAYADAAVAVETSRAETAEALKAPLASPALTGTPTAPTASAGTDTTQLATTAFVGTAVTGLAPLASPALTGNPTAPTQTTGDDSTKIATDQFVTTAVAAETSRAETAEGLLAPKASPALTGTPTAPTASALTDSTQLATTAYADSAVGVETSRAEAAEALKAPLASPALTGAPTAPTASALTDSTQVATTAYTDSAVAVETSRAEAAEALKAPLASPALTGTPTAPTASGGTNTTQVATTAYAYAAAQSAQSAAEAASVPASDLPLSIANGGSGQITAAAAYNALSPMTTKGDMEYDSSGGAAARLAVGSAGQVLGVSGGVPAWGMGLTLLATTGINGHALVNGTGTIISWTAPNDGQLHRVMVACQAFGASAIGGETAFSFTDPAGHASGAQLLTSAGPSGIAYAQPWFIFVEANTTVTVTQFTALTGGSATVWPELWGS